MFWFICILSGFTVKDSTLDSEEDILPALLSVGIKDINTLFNEANDSDFGTGDDVMVYDYVPVNFEGAVDASKLS